MPKKTDFEPGAEAQPERTPAPAPAPAPVKLQPNEWAAKLGHVRVGDARLPQSSQLFSAAHVVADLLHGWTKHLHHYQSAPLLISQADYEAALKAAGEYPSTPAHEPALSPVKRPKER